nr:UrcA family protein [uncultured Sphingomonas sp.]
MYRNLIALSLIASGLGTGIASAQVTVYGSDVATAHVSYADLNLASDEGQDRLKTRIHTAAKSICFDNNIDPLYLSAARDRCFDGAVRDGMAQMNDAMNQSLARNGGSGTQIVLRAR